MKNVSTNKKVIVTTTTTTNTYSFDNFSEMVEWLKSMPCPKVGEPSIRRKIHFKATKGNLAKKKFEGDLVVFGEWGDPDKPMEPRFWTWSKCFQLVSNKESFDFERYFDIEDKPIDSVFAKDFNLKDFVGEESCIEVKEAIEGE